MTDPFIITEDGGRRVLAVNWMTLDKYLAVPRHWRWLFYLKYALFAHVMYLAFNENEENYEG